MSLPYAVRDTLEALFCADLGQVRVYLDSSQATAFGARAFAYGDQIHVASGAYVAHSAEEYRVLAHEVAHVLQQRNRRVPESDRARPFVDAALEWEADVAGACAAALFVARQRLGERHVPHVSMGAMSFCQKPPRTGGYTGTRAVQCLMDEQAFKQASPAAGLRNKIAVVDRELAAFLSLDKAKPRNYTALLAQLRTLFAAANGYRQANPTSKRNAGVDMLLRQIGMEEMLLVPLAAFQAEPDPVKKFEQLETAQELVLQLERRPDFKRNAGSQEVIDLINANANVLRNAGAAAGAVGRDIDELRKLGDRDTMPPILRSIIKECTNGANTRQVDMKINRPGAMFNTANGATQKYTLNHATEQYLGKKFRMGSLLHELTHISIAETFQNTCVMLAIKSTATDQEMLALARERNAKISRLQNLLGASQMDAQLKKECIDKAGYAVGTKFASYVGAFRTQLGDATVQRLNGLLAQGMSSELVEYDTVINQMALWCHLWGVAETSPAYAELLVQAKDAFWYRTRNRHAAKPLPPLPIRPAVVVQPTGLGGGAHVRPVAKPPSFPPRKPLPLPPKPR